MTDDLAPFRGLMYGTVFGLLIWAALIALVVAVCR
jgi:hypothetical protein